VLRTATPKKNVDASWVIYLVTGHQYARQMKQAVAADTHVACPPVGGCWRERADEHPRTRCVIAAAAAAGAEVEVVGVHSCIL
jgi:hypothetical protein